MSDKTVKIVLQLDGKQYSAELQMAGREAQRFAGQMDSSARAASASVEGLTGHLGRMGGALAGVVSAQQFVQAADAITVLNNRLQLATGSAAAAANAYQNLFAIAQASRSSFTELGATFATIRTATAELGISQSRLLKVTESIGNAMAISGGSAQSMQAALVQLGQGLASGTLRGEELNSVMEQTPRLAQALAEGLGVSRGELRKLGEQGLITSEALVKALESQADKLRGEVAGSVQTVAQGWTVLGNATTKAVGDIDAVTGASAGLSRALSSLGGAVTGVGDAIRNNEEVIKTTLGVLAGAAVAAGALRVAASLGSVATAVTAVRVAFMALSGAMAANPLGIALLGLAAVGGGIYAHAQATKNTADGIRKQIAALEAENREAPSIYGRDEASMQRHHQAQVARLEQIKKLRGALAELDVKGLDNRAEDARLDRQTEALAKQSRAAKEAQEALDLINAKSAKLPSGYVEEMTALMKARNANLIDEKRYQQELARLDQERMKAQTAGNSRGAAQVDRQALAAEVAAIEQQQAQIASQAERARKALDSQHSAGLLGERAYLQAKRDLTLQANADLREQHAAELAAVERSKVATKDKAAARLAHNADVAKLREADLAAEADYQNGLTAFEAKAARERATARANARTAEADGIAQWIAEQEAAQRQSLASVRQRVQGLADEAEALRISTVLNVSLAEAIERVAIMRLQERQAKMREDTPQWEALQREIDLRRTLAAEVGKKEARETAKKTADEYARELDRVVDQYQQGLTNAAMAGGKSLREHILGMLRTTAFRLVLEPVMRPLAALAGGVSSGISNALGLGSNGPSAGAGGGVLGGVATNAAGSYVSNALMGAGGVWGSSAAYGAALGTTSIGAGSQAAMLSAQTGVFGAQGAAATAAAAGNTGMASFLSAAPYMAAVVALAALVAGSAKGETRHGGQYALSLDGSVHNPRRDMTTQGVKGINFLEGPSGGEVDGGTVRKSIDDTVKGINQLLAKYSSTASVVAFNAGLEASEKGRGGVFVGGLLSNGRRFGETGQGDNYQGTLFESGSSTADQAELLKRFSTDLGTATLQALKAAGDELPLFVRRKLDSYGDLEKLTQEQTTAAVQEIAALPDVLLGKIGTTRDALVKTFTEGLLAGDPRGAGQAVATQIVDSIGGAMLGDAAGRIFDIFNTGVLSPIIDAAINNATISEAVAQASIEQAVQRATATAQAFSAIWNNAEFQGLLSGLRTTLGKAFGDAGAAMNYTARRATATSAAVDNVAQSLDDLAKRAVDATKSLADENKTLQAQLLREAGDEAGARAIERAQYLADLSELGAAEQARLGLLWDQNQALRDQVTAAQTAREAVEGFWGSVDGAIDRFLTGADLALYRSARMAQTLNKSGVPLGDEIAAGRALAGLTEPQIKSLVAQFVALPSASAQAKQAVIDVGVGLLDLIEAAKQARITLGDTAAGLMDKLLGPGSSMATRADLLAERLRDADPRLSGLTSAAMLSAGKEGLAAFSREVLRSGDISDDTKTEILGLVGAVADLQDGARQATRAMHDNAASLADKLLAPAEATALRATLIAQRAGELDARLAGVTGGALLSASKADLTAFAQTVFALGDISAETKSELFGLVGQVLDLQSAATAALGTGTDDALRSLEQAAEAERTLLTARVEAAQATADIARRMRDALASAVSSVRGLSQDLSRADQLVARAQVAQWAESARLGQGLSTTEAFAEQLARATELAVASVGEQDAVRRYASAFDAERDRRVLAGELERLQATAGDQLTEAERVAQASEAALKALDEQITAQREAIDVMRGVRDATALTIPQALDRLSAAVAAEQAIRSAQASAARLPNATAATAQAGAGVGIGSGGLVRWESDGGTQMAWASDLRAAGAAHLGAGGSKAAIVDAVLNAGLASQADAILGLPPGTFDAEARAAGRVPSYDVGTPFVPRDQLAIVHRGEAIVPAALNPWGPGQQRSSGQAGHGGGGMHALTAELSRQRAEQRAESLALTRQMMRMRKVLESWNFDGMPRERVA